MSGPVRTTSPRAAVTVTARSVLVALVAASAVAIPSALSPAQARPIPADPGSGFGYGFDTCDAPSQRTMSAWHQHSHYSAVGVYIGGANRACETQRHLDRRWVRTQRAAGWRLLPLVVGRQASCSPRGRYAYEISPNPSGTYATARRQGVASARGAVRAARRLGLGRRTVLWFDLEAFDITRTHCRRSALHFVTGWTRQLHRARYRSGLYSSASTLTMLEPALPYRGRIFALPDYLWFAHWNGRATVHTSYLRKTVWMPHQRVHQFRGGHRERHGGRRLVVDSNYYSLGRGIWVQRERPHCGVRVSFAAYEPKERGDRGAGVRAAQCLLRRHHAKPRRRPDGVFDRALARRVRRFQRHHDLPVSGEVTTRTWVALLARGDTPVLKYGSQGAAVRRAQRALNATRRASLPVDGVFGLADAAAVKRYQRRHHVRATGVLNDATWRRLQAGGR